MREQRAGGRGEALERKGAWSSDARALWRDEGRIRSDVRRKKRRELGRNTKWRSIRIVRCGVFRSTFEWTNWSVRGQLTVNFWGNWFNRRSVRFQKLLKIRGNSLKILAMSERKNADPNGLRVPVKSAYERLRTVGKGAFGTAILYRRKRDGLRVIMKEINMLDLNSYERQMALNEVKVLSTLHHPNIITYFDSFEEDGILMIEMEFADGGTLHDWLSQLERPMDERTVLTLFGQTVNAIEYMHRKLVLHRDLKTANIFLTKENEVKIGDFGISKMTSTRSSRVNTVVGTPYYISPEMCEGKGYDDKSDIWALGCILYEMVCLHRTFEGTNLPALVHKIMKGQFSPIRGNYSHEFRQLVRDMLQQEPTFRPSASEIVQNRLPILMKQCESGEQKLSQTSSLKDHRNKRQSRSVLYLMRFMDKTLDLLPVPLPSRQVIQQLAVSATHCIALTSDARVYAWGDNDHQQLGLDQSPARVERPALVRAFKATNVSRVGAGHGFSIFSCNNGLLMSVGDGRRGCLGHGDWSSVSKPKIVEKLLGMAVTAVSCGPHHVAVVADERFAFSWGSGSKGRLGHGTEESALCPTELLFPEDVAIRDIRCGRDNTVFLTSNGKAWACGSNAGNKLGLNSNGRFWKRNQECVHQLVPGKLRGISRAVVDASLGPNHTALLLDNGQVMTSGANGDGQLGRGHDGIDNDGFKVVTVIKDKTVYLVQCGDTFSVMTTVDNALYFWGRRQVASRESVVSWDVDSDRPSQRSSDLTSGPRTAELTSTKSLKPEEMLVLYASPEQVVSGERVTIAGLRCAARSVHLLVSTTASVPHRDDQCPNLVHERKARVNAVNEVKNPEDETALIPDWLRKEFEESEDWWQRHAEAGAP